MIEKMFLCQLFLVPMLSTAQLLAEAPEPGPAPQDALNDARALYDEGSVKFDAADYEGAIESFTTALALVRNAGDDGVRLVLIYNIASAHERQFTIDHDVAHLRQARDLYEQYLQYAEQTGDLGEQLDVESRLQKLTRKLRAHDQIRSDARPGVANRVPPPPPSSSPDVQRQDRRGLGLGLLVPGAVAVFGGVVMLAAGSRYEPNARAQVAELADLGVPMDHPAWAEGDRFIAQERRRGVVLMGLGGALAGLGVVGVVAGGVVFGKRPRLPAVRLSVHTRLPGVALQGVF